MDREVAQVPYFAYEGEMARSERTIKRLWILVIMLIVLTIITNILWIWFVMHYDCIQATDSNSVTDSEQSEVDHVRLHGSQYHGV